MKLSQHFLCDGCHRKRGQPHAKDCKLVKPKTNRKKMTKSGADYLAKKYG